ncbi:hypothetical protein GEMRC1_011402 [Eukaryota sp. GEM-RC1]
MSRPRRAQAIQQQRELDAIKKVLEAFHHQGEWTTEKFTLITLLREYLNVPEEHFSQELSVLSGNDTLMSLSTSSPLPPPPRAETPKDTSTKRPSKPKPQPQPSYTAAPVTIRPQFITPISGRSCDGAS